MYLFKLNLLLLLYFFFSYHTEELTLKIECKYLALYLIFRSFFVCLFRFSILCVICASISTAASSPIYNGGWQITTDS